MSVSYSIEHTVAEVQNVHLGSPRNRLPARSIQFPRFPPFYILWLGYGIRVEFSPEATTSQLCLPVEEGECK
jgi:hypothetical protein